MNYNREPHVFRASLGLLSKELPGKIRELRAMENMDYPWIRFFTARSRPGRKPTPHRPPAPPDTLQGKRD